jgi:histone acetyltransferase (RNA polymerase elongator complex component)
MTNAPSCHNPNKTTGIRPFIVPIFIPHAGCPHQCAFCNQTHIADRPGDMPSKESITAEITRFLGFRQAHHQVPQISFYGGTFLGIGEERILTLLDLATRFISRGQAGSIRFSTRPDTITPATMDLIHDFPVRTIELGVQSMDDRVLQHARRGHTALDTRRAVALLKERGYDIGLQMMIGLPSQDESSAMSTAHEMAALRPDAVRIYPAIVLKNSLMAAWYQDGVYEPLSLDTAVAQTKRLYAFFNDKQIPVIRMGLQASESLGFDKAIVAGPYHPAFGHLVLSAVFLEKAEHLLEQLDPGTEPAILRIHPRNESRLRGLQNSNIKWLQERFCFRKITILADSRLSMETVELDPLS